MAEIKRGDGPANRFVTIRTLVPPPQELLDEMNVCENGDFFESHPGIPINMPSDFGDGLGDRLIYLRLATGFARHFPNRQFIAWTVGLETVAESPYFNLPPNVSNDLDIGKTIPLSLQHPNQYMGQSRVYEYLLKGQSNRYDLNAMSYIATNGAIIDPALFYEPIFRISPEQLAAHPITTDVLVFPDAFELSQGNHSLKSFSPEKWAEVFTMLDPSLKVSIVIGTSHPEYCHAVVDSARVAGHKDVGMIQGSLPDIINAILSTRKFVGMDSGTTHLAGEVIRAARVSGRTIDFREFFLAGYYVFNTYGITDPADLFRTLVYMAETDPGGSMDDLDAEVVADFIQS